MRSSVLCAALASVLPNTAAAAPCALERLDRGIYPELACRVRLELPGWLAAGPRLQLSSPAGRRAGLRFVYAAGGPVALDSGAAALALADLGANDADGDGVPDALDILIGAKKVALNGALYRESYRVLAYPGGDVPRSEGVCTDVVIRALRNAGLDLQRLVHEDIKRAPRAYPTVRRPDPSIDHRRVRTLLSYFARHWRALPAERDGARVPLLPGDVVFMDTMRDPRPEHIGIISDRVGRSGFPLVVNNWTVGHRESEMDLLGSVPITHRFRVRGGRLPLPAAARGLDGLLARGGVRVPAETRQALVVTTPLWSASGGALERYDRASGGEWRRVGRLIEVRVGARGLGRGRGLHGAETSLAAALAAMPPKREGDRRSPAGVFGFGVAFGQSARRPHAPGSWPWRRVDSRDRFVDDPASVYYNSWQRTPAAGARTLAWRSAEELAQYSLGIVVEHNMGPVARGAGSAIFIHAASSLRAPSIGCTLLAERELVEVLRWLSPAARPVLVQLPGTIFD